MPPRLPAVASLKSLILSRPLSRALTTTPRRLRDDDDDSTDSPSMSTVTKMRGNITKSERDTQAILTAYETFLTGAASNFKTPLYNETNYLGSYELDSFERKRGASTDVPFPLNFNFRAPPVLSDEFRIEIHRMVMERGRSVRSVSAQFGVSLERVAAVVRLKEVEKQMAEKEGFKPATFLTKCLASMMKVTELPREGVQQARHEDIQELAIHKRGLRQAFVPVSESRAYTRADAGRELGLPEPEDAIPHPELVVLERERWIEGVDREQRVRREMERDLLLMGQEKQKREEAKAKKAAEGNIVESGRWKWRLQEAQTGKVGFRYGVPHQDRKKGQVKIPTRVD